MNKSLVIIPAYNEEHSIGEVIQGIQQQQLNLEILVVNDGSMDRTVEVAHRYGVHVISHPVNLGYGSALQTGFKFASQRKYPYIIQFDADGQHDPASLQAMVQAMEEGNSDVTIGSRYLSSKGSLEMTVGPFKRMVAMLFRIIIYLMTGTRITDPTSGLRAFRRRTYSFYAVRNRFPAEFPDADFLIRMLLSNNKITEVRANMRDRAHGKGMHHGVLKPTIYMFRIVLNILIVLIQHKIVLRVKKNA